LKVKKSFSTIARIVLSFDYFSLITIPTSKYNLGSIDLLAGEMNYAIIIEKRNYRVDGFYERRKIYLGYK
jgi:hypothetical protein